MSCGSRAGRRRRHGTLARGLLGAAVIIVAVLQVIATAPGNGTKAPELAPPIRTPASSGGVSWDGSSGGHIEEAARSSDPQGTGGNGSRASLGGMSLSEPRRPAASSPTPPWSLGISASPSTVCAYGVALCPAGTNTTRLALTAQTPAPSAGNWSSVQLLFVLDFGLFAGGGELGWPYANLSPDISGADRYFAINARRDRPIDRCGASVGEHVVRPRRNGWNSGPERVG